MLRTMAFPWGALGRRPDAPHVPVEPPVERLSAIDLLPLLRRLPLLRHQVRRSAPVQAHVLEFLLNWIERLADQATLPAPAPDPFWEQVVHESWQVLDAVRALIDPCKRELRPEVVINPHPAVQEVRVWAEAKRAEVAALQGLVAERDQRIWDLQREVQALRDAASSEKAVDTRA